MDYIVLYVKLAYHCERDDISAQDDITHLRNTISKEKPEISQMNDKSVHDGFGIWKGILDGFMHERLFFFFNLLRKLKF